MARLENLSEKTELLNDVEVEDTLSKDIEILPGLRDKPLSPILSGGLNNRKFLIGRRLSYKKSRIKLTNRFKESDMSRLVNPINLPIPVSLDDSLSDSQTNTLLDHLDKLEELEKRRNDLYNVLVGKKKDNDNFKVPKSPATVKEIKSSTVNVTNINLENECTSRRQILNEVIPISSKEVSVSFQTAAGKGISISETDINMHSKLFDDIMYSMQSCSEGRPNKHMFLRKVNSPQHNALKTNANSIVSDGHINVNNLECSKSVKEDMLIPLNPLKTVSSESSSNMKISEKAMLHAKQFFNGEEFADIAFNNELCGFNKASAHLFTSASKNASKEIGNSLGNGKDTELSLTQAIYESGISNTQMSSAVDNILCSGEGNEKDCFKGFTKKKAIESCTKFQSMETFLANIELNYSFHNSKKNKYHDVDDFHLPPKKKLRNFIQNKENNFLIINNNLGGFSSASGKCIKISENSLRKAKSIFDKLNLDIYNANLNDKLTALQRSSTDNEQGEKLNILNDVLESECCAGKIIIGEKKYQNSNMQIQFVTDKCIQQNISGCDPDFYKPSSKAINISESSIKHTKNTFVNLSMDHCHQDDDSTLVPQTSNTSLAENIKIEHLNIQGKSLKNVSSTQSAIISNQFSLINEKPLFGTTPVKLNNLLTCEGTNVGAICSKKKLGVSHCKQIQICHSKLNKAKLLFHKDFSEISPIRPRENNTYTSTPVVRQNSCSTPIRNDSLRSTRSFSSFVDMAGITPIKMDIIDNKPEDIIYKPNMKILFTSPTNGNWLDDLETEKKNLENRLQVLIERQKLGLKALEYLEVGKSDHDKKPREGHLYKMKTTSTRVSMISFVENRKPGDISMRDILPINPKNAENLHFKDQVSPAVLTEDGAVVIPNLQDIVGLCEIKNAFEAMPGVDPQLIPNGWIRNHYKWIVWKLSSYQNVFPNNFSGCMNIENIIQQLKYRYDREIDRAERSALRKIYEKDDAPQKRIILFVSDIKMLDTKKYELELSDGWYAIRTVIDEPLCNQIVNGKIQIGTKLIISGAELINCDGCYPLEATNLVCLKISCNSTRRAIWHARLGFQRNPNPFPIQLESIHPDGGTIGAIKICVVRMYPLKYMEKLEGRSVWRNRKAEEIVAQKWENERIKKLEKIQDQVRKKFECSIKSAISTSSNTDVSNINCPKELHDILERSSDPECLQHNLSTSQKEAILDYQRNLSMKKQEEMAAEVNESIAKLKLTRDAVAMLKLLVVDVKEYSDRPFNFFIWRPSETHLQSLKEGKSFTIQNVMPRPNGDLCSNMKTTFKMENASYCSRCIKYKRRFVQLAELVESKLLPDFNEFDTVGIVVQTKIESHIQEVWMADNSGRLLFIKIYEGPNTCLILDNLKRGQATTVCNLVYHGLKKNIIQAVANHCTIFSSYSQHKHLQQGLEVFKKEITKDLQNLLNDCDSKIEVFNIISDIKNSFSENFEDTGTLC